MKKMLTNFQNVFKNNETFEHQQKVNSLMNLIFQEKETAVSIKIFKDVKKKFEQEIAKRGIDGLIEHTTCQEYFHKNQHLD